MASDLKRSTSHAIYLIRRIQDYGEIKGAPMCMALFDWEKAFDKVLHERMFNALRRLDIDEHIIQVLMDCYQNPTFYVEDEHGQSEIKKQGTGTRQGCPLSPYLFVLVMHCIDHDINQNKSRGVFDRRLPNLDLDLVHFVFPLNQNSSACFWLLFDLAQP